MTDLDKKRSEAQLRKAQQAEDGRKAMAEYEANVLAVRARTERLRAMRLAREAAAKVPVAVVAPAPEKKRRSKAAPIKAAS